ncbi:MAG: sugar-binding transcriptional regulator [Anaerolineae bacterium]|nr:sugar-binding transcriptional regulator [Anaerolineae bacterium]
MTISSDQERFLYKIAQAYYQQRQTQQEIARRYAISRPTVSRLLQKARDTGIVHITLVPPDNGYTDMERALEEYFHLEEMLIVPVQATASAAHIADALGPIAAGCLLRSMTGNEVVGFAWGRTIRSMVDSLPGRTWPGVTIVQMTGGLGQVETAEHSTELTRRVADKFHAQLRLLPAPGIVTSKAVANALCREPQIRSTLDLASRADIAVVGLGVPTEDSIVMRYGPLLSEIDLQSLKAAGAVGDIALRYICATGEAVTGEINQRIVGLTLAQIRAINRVIGIAGGAGKYDVIRAALRGGILDVLVTDHLTAARLYREEVDYAQKS